MDGTLTFNGIDLDTGTYAMEPMPIEAFVNRVLRAGGPEDLTELQARARYVNEPHYAPVEGVDPKKLEETGWGVVFPFGQDPAIRAALKPLLDWRRDQATKTNAKLYRELFGKDGYRGGEHPENKNDFLERFDAGGGGAVDPEQLPYYLMLVGSPEEIPFTFQYQLDIQYAVGRIHFETIEDYARYAAGVVDAEKNPRAPLKRAVFFGTANDEDRATAQSSSLLVTPLADLMAKDQASWKIETVLSGDATKARLARLLGGDDTPALLFTASHGVCVRADNPKQSAANGALICQDWPGPVAGGLAPEHYFSGDDVASDAKLAGLITFHFACFSAGTPMQDDFAGDDAKAPKTLAPRPFVSRLPQRLLRGGALAAVGHVDRAWTYSFKSDSSTAQLRVFKSTLKRLMEGHPVGSALEYFNNRYAELSSDVAARIRAARFGDPPDPHDLAYRWQSSSDARNYSIVGDPAVRI
jgi:hypothetical protein